MHTEISPVEDEDRPEHVAQHRTRIMVNALAPVARAASI